MTYIAIDLKSFYASVECVERGLDPLRTNLVVADASRTDKTICLAVSPPLKAYGIGGRARLFEVNQRLRTVNADRRRALHDKRFTGKSYLADELEAHPDWEVDFIAAPPRMAHYIECSTRIYNIYLRFIAPEDIHVYSIDEVFIDATPYLATYHMTAHELARTIIKDILAETGITAYSVFTLLKRASELCGMSLLDATCPIASLLRQRIWWWVYQDEQYETDDNIDILDGKAAITDIVASWDPNEMCGPAGVGAEHYIGQAQTLNYRILFENKAEAGDAAYRIRISDELDPNIFDVSSVRFGETSHDGVGYNWKMTREGNTLKWDIEGIELPPNVNAPEGEGFVSFFVDLKPGLADGTQIKNKAEIIFDRNFPIETNEYVNILDITPPTTTMANVTYDAATQSAQVNCQADDAASGLDSYLLFASKNGSDYAYMGQYYTNSIACPVEPEAVYSFYVLAIDAVGNAEHIRPQVVNISTGISTPRSTSDGSLSTTAVFTLDGRYVGKLLSGLKKGVYVIRTSGKDDTGKKIVVK